MNYEEIGFKCGIEIHQQLEGKKLFCSCPCHNSPEKTDIIIKRKLRAVVGEQGKIDRAASDEMKKGKNFIYEASSKNTCLVEFDEEPPHPINPEAVQAVLQVAQLMNAKVVDEIQIMRKIVVDGSNVSGFQRTALVAIDGFIDTTKGKVKIETICLEEEAAQKKEETKEYTKYRIDRLGIPLIEIATAPDIKDPEHAKETAEKIGLILRSTGKAKRGIGTIRQDVNVSIKGHPRIEIKGFQDLRSIPKIIEYEIKRQTEEIRRHKEKNTEKKGNTETTETNTKPESHVRKAEPDNTTSFLRNMPGSSRLYPETDALPIKIEKINIENIEMIEDIAKRYENIGLDKELSKKIAKSEKKELFEKLIKLKNLKPAFIADVIFSSEKNIKKQYNTDISIPENIFYEALSKIDKGEASKNFLIEILYKLTQNEKIDYSKYKGIDNTEIEKIIDKIIKENKGAPIGTLMGKTMAQHKGD